MSAKFSLTTESVETPPTVIPFKDIKEAALGKHYDLSLVFTTSAKIRELNKKYRDKDVATDILSFPLSQNEGEIFICLEEARKEAKKFNRAFENFIGFLFIHGCIHLKGHDHGSMMESEEAKFRTRLGI